MNIVNPSLVLRQAIGENWHEGVELIGYWPEGKSFLLKGRNDHVLCVTAGFLRELFVGKLREAEEELLIESNGIAPELEEILQREQRDPKPY